MNHLVEKGITKVIGSYVEVSPNVDGRGIAIVSVVPPTPCDSDWNRYEEVAEVLVVELVKPQP